MKKGLKDTFVPHKENDHKPHLLQKVGVIAIVVVAVIAFIGSALHASLLLKNSDFLAAVFPKVVADLTNEDRYENGLSTLTYNETLAQAAQLKANHMAQHSYFAHESPDGITPWHWFRAAGYTFISAGENLAVNFADSDDVERAWMDSPGHRANILNNKFTEIGIATAEGTYQGRKTVFVVQLFGTPAPARPVFAQAAPTPQTPPTPEQGEEPEPQVLPSTQVPATSELAPQPEPTPVEEPVVAEETETFIQVEVPEVVEEAPAPEIEVGGPQLAGEQATGLVPQASFWERLMSQPRTILSWIYILLGALIVLVLTATIFIEIEKQHPKHIAYGVFLLVLLVGLAYLNKGIVFADLVIA